MYRIVSRIHPACNSIRTTQALSRQKKTRVYSDSNNYTLIRIYIYGNKKNQKQCTERFKVSFPCSKIDSCKITYTCPSLPPVSFTNVVNAAIVIIFEYANLFRFKCYTISNRKKLILHDFLGASITRERFAQSAGIHKFFSTNI